MDRIIKQSNIDLQAFPKLFHKDRKGATNLPAGRQGFTEKMKNVFLCFLSLLSGFCASFKTFVQTNLSKQEISMGYNYIYHVLKMNL